MASLVPVGGLLPFGTCRCPPDWQAAHAVSLWEPVSHVWPTSSERNIFPSERFLILANFVDDCIIRCTALQMGAAPER